MVKIGLEVMGGDLGPLPALKGAYRALNKGDCSIYLIGNQDEIKDLARFHKIDLSPFKILHSSEVVKMDDSPTKSLKRKPNSSIKIAFEALRDGEIDALVTPSNTGAVVVTAIYTLGLYPFIKRPGIGTLIPRMDEKRPFLLIDAGATTDCDATNLLQFGILGSLYYKLLTGFDQPRVALISNGSEENKGTDTVKSAHQIFKSKFQDQFVGNIEGRDLLKDVADVGVCDGFVGNIILKCLEGTAEFVINFIKENLKWHPIAALGLWLASGHLKRLFYRKLSASAYGGAPLLGVKGLTTICHGSSNEYAYCNSILITKRFVEKKLHLEIEKSFDGLDGVN
ncbi:MAG: phosphate acyltransferase PlsX [Deltaproteobacteria bacterium]|nr:phosphate acyltransferase PlsX [Deltaproteobacteria bacterium]